MLLLLLLTGGLLHTHVLKQVSFIMQTNSCMMRLQESHDHISGLHVQLNIFVYLIHGSWMSPAVQNTFSFHLKRSLILNLFIFLLQFFPKVNICYFFLLDRNVSQLSWTINWSADVLFQWGTERSRSQKSDSEIHRISFIYGEGGLRGSMVQNCLSAEQTASGVHQRAQRGSRAADLSVLGDYITGSDQIQKRAVDSAHLCLHDHCLTSRFSF